MGPPWRPTSPSLWCLIHVLICVLATLLTISAPGQIQDAGLWLNAFTEGEFWSPALRERNARWWFDANTRYIGAACPLLQSVIWPSMKYFCISKRLIGALKLHTTRIVFFWGLAVGHSNEKLDPLIVKIHPKKRSQ